MCQQIIQVVNNDVRITKFYYIILGEDNEEFKNKTVMDC